MRPRGNVNSLWYNKTEERQSQQMPPPFWGDTKGSPTYEDKTDFIVLHDEASDSNAAQDLVDRGAPVPDNRQKLGWMRGKREVQVVVPARPAPRAYEPPPRRYRIRWPKLIFTTLLILVLFVGVGYGVFTLVRLASGSISDLVASKQAGSADQEPLVERVLINGEPWHRITFYGKDGEVVLVDNPRRSLPIQNGKAELMLNDESYITDDLTEDKVTVSLEAKIIPPEGKERLVTIQPYSIDVPMAPLKIVLPAEQSVTTNEDSMLIKIKVTPGSKRVLIGGSNVTDKVNAEGFVSTTMAINPSGVNTILIVVETAKHRRNNFELKINRPVMDVPILLEKPEDNSTSGNTIVISGSTQAGATITTDAPLSGKVTMEASGLFRFTAKLKRWGWNTISITATSQSGLTSTMVHKVNRVPQLASYTGKAWKALDNFDYITTSAEALIGQVVKLEGMIVKKLESEVSDYYLFNIGQPGQTKLLVVEYSKEDGLKADQYYNIYADINGTLDGYPILTARFVYPVEMPAGYTAAPETAATPEPTATEGA